MYNRTNLIGQTISHYRITEKLGEGGMGVVYKAEDTKLERTVALKFLASHLLNDDDAKARFLREAKAAATLHHANICPVYEIDEAEGRTFISMAFIEGETLEERIAKGPLSLKDALDIGRQVADGLDAAHDKGIVHRDIKPANILLDSKGRATIMDFGLARLTEASRLTKADTTMGTVAYMSPEQAQGLEVDHRSDIWALGCVLYEMVCGQKPFKGVYDKALLYEIVHQEPEPLTGLRTGVPIELELLVGECIAKDRDDRTGTAQEVARKLRTLAEKLKSGRSTILRTVNLPAGLPATLTAGQTVIPIQALPPEAMIVRRSSQRALQAVAAVATLALLGVLFVHFTGSPPPELPVRRFSFAPEGLGIAAVSPDGRYIVFSARQDSEYSLWVRALESETTRQLPGTGGVRLSPAVGFPLAGAWSPDSQAIVFATADEMRRVSISGGAPVRLCELPNRSGNSFGGASWSPDGERIVFASGSSLWEVPARGGQPRILLEDSGVAFQLPSSLPADGGSQGLVYTVYPRGSTEGPTLEVLDLNTGERSILGPGEMPVYAGGGHLLHHNQDGLAATPFSLETLTATGDTFPVDVNGAFASLSRDGTLVYTDFETSRGTDQMVVRNRSGEIVRTVGGRIADAYEPAVSPDGRRVAARVKEDIWVYDLDRDLGTRLTSREGSERSPAWFSSGRELSYTLDLTGVATQVADGSVEAKVLFDDAKNLTTRLVWSSDDRYLAYGAADPAGGEGGIWYRERRPDGSLSEPVSFLRTPAQENTPSFSPDGRYLAYHSNESGRQEIYVRPFPGGPGKWQVSTNGGGFPRWSADGKEIFYVEGRALMAVAVATSGNFTVGLPQRLFESSEFLAARYDIFPDGQRFLTIGPAADVADDSPPKSVRIVQNWYEEFRDRERD